MPRCADPVELAFVFSEVVDQWFVPIYVEHPHSMVPNDVVLSAHVILGGGDYSLRLPVPVGD